jgi:hypothetical protein
LKTGGENGMILIPSKGVIQYDPRQQKTLSPFFRFVVYCSHAKKDIMA